MKKQPFIFFSLAILSTYLLAAPAAAVLAATSTPTQNPSNVGQALEIAPPVVNLTVNPGQTTSVQIFLRDISQSNLVVTGQANDFVAAGVDGTPKVLVNNEPSPYSMKDWVAPLPSLLLVPREIKTMTATLHVPATASPGGHYAVIRFTATPPELKNTGVSLSASLGALLLVTVTGKINEDVSLAAFTANQSGKTGTLFESTPINFAETFKNNGNVHAQPTGRVTIKDILGHDVASVNVNLPPKNVLPASERTFEEPLDKSVIGDKFLFGRYTANLSVTYGESKQVITGKLTFWVVPYRLIAVSLVAIIGGFFLLRFLISRYNRHIISQAQHRHRY